MEDRIYFMDRRVECYKKSVSESKKLTESNKTKIFEFINQMRANKLSLVRQSTYLG